MPQQPVELILLRQVASYLDTPMFIVAADGDLLYFNEAAEPLLGMRFDEVGEMPMAGWLEGFRPGDRRGRPLERDAVPLVIALEQGRAVQERLTIVDRDGTRHRILNTSFPLRGQSGKVLGAVALFWPDDAPVASATADGPDGLQAEAERRETPPRSSPTG